MITGHEAMLKWNSTWRIHVLPVWAKKKIRSSELKKGNWVSYDYAARFLPTGVFDHWGTVLIDGIFALVSQPYGDLAQGELLAEKAAAWAAEVGCFFDWVISPAPWNRGTHLFIFTPWGDKEPRNRRNNMYQCNRCKKEFSGEPAVKNGAGSFCQSCEDYRNQRRKDAQNQNRLRDVPKCLWCDDALNPAEVSRGNICPTCNSGRTWLLKCIRNSDRPAHYVAKREVEEAPARETREAVRLRSEIVAHEKTHPGRAAQNLAEDRLGRLEGMMEKLMKALGE